MTDPVNEAVERLRIAEQSRRPGGQSICWADDLRTVLDALEAERQLADELAESVMLLWTAVERSFQSHADDREWTQQTAKPTARDALARWEARRG